MVSVLTDPAKFWGEHVIPTISRDDPAFADQQYWRGTIWPPMNYLIYQGLRRYRFDAEAAELARRSVALFLGDWHEHRLCRENFDSRTGAGGGHRYQSWGPLFALIGVEEFLDVSPWDGLRIGSASVSAQTTLRRLRACGHEWTITLAPTGLRVEMDGGGVAERPGGGGQARGERPKLSGGLRGSPALKCGTSPDLTPRSPSPRMWRGGQGVRLNGVERGTGGEAQNPTPTRIRKDRVL